MELVVKVGLNGQWIMSWCPNVPPCIFGSSSTDDVHAWQCNSTYRQPSLQGILLITPTLACWNGLRSRQIKHLLDELCRKLQQGTSSSSNRRLVSKSATITQLKIKPLLAVHAMRTRCQVDANRRSGRTHL
jgi:hypothetical protein